MQVPGRDTLRATSLQIASKAAGGIHCKHMIDQVRNCHPKIKNIQLFLRNLQVNLREEYILAAGGPSKKLLRKPFEIQVGNHSKTIKYGICFRQIANKAAGGKHANVDARMHAHDVHTCMDAYVYT